MNLSDRIKRSWAPAKWQDERQTVAKPRAFQGSSVSDNRKLGRYGR